MHHAHDNHLMVCKPVVDGIMTMEMHPQPGREMVPGRAKLRMVQKWRKALLNFVNERARRLGIVLCNEQPDVG